MRVRELKNLQIIFTKFNPIFNFYVIDFSPPQDYSNWEVVIFCIFLLLSTVLSTNIHSIESLKLKKTFFEKYMLISSLLSFWEKKVYKITSFISQKIELYLSWNHSWSKISKIGLLAGIITLGSIILSQDSINNELQKDNCDFFFKQCSLKHFFRWMPVRWN